MSYFNKKMEDFKSRVVNNDDGELYCATCGAEKNLVEDKNNEGIYYCLECLEKSWRHDEMIVMGYETSPEVGD